MAWSMLQPRRVARDVLRVGEEVHRVDVRAPFIGILEALVDVDVLLVGFERPQDALEALVERKLRQVTTHHLGVVVNVGHAVRHVKDEQPLGRRGGRGDGQTTQVESSRGGQAERRRPQEYTPLNSLRSSSHTRAVTILSQAASIRTEAMSPRGGCWQTCHVPSDSSAFFALEPGVLVPWNPETSGFALSAAVRLPARGFDAKCVYGRRAWRLSRSCDAARIVPKLGLKTASTRNLRAGESVRVQRSLLLHTH